MPIIIRGELRDEDMLFLIQNNKLSTFIQNLKTKSFVHRPHFLGSVHENIKYYFSIYISPLCNTVNRPINL